jgi:hypothetical protein
MTNKDNEIKQLQARVDKLEDMIRELLPNRRDVLKAGGAAAIGAVALSGSASAGSSQVGTIGSSTDLVDVHAEDLIDVDTINGDQPVTSGESYAYQITDNQGSSNDPVVIEFKV